MAGAPLRASALLRSRSPSFAGYDDFSFAAAARPEQGLASHGSDEDEDNAARRPSDNGKLVADKLRADDRPQRRRRPSR